MPPALPRHEPTAAPQRHPLRPGRSAWRGRGIGRTYVTLTHGLQLRVIHAATGEPCPSSRLTPPATTSPRLRSKTPMATASLRATLLRCSPSFQAGHPLLDRREQTDPSYSTPVLSAPSLPPRCDGACTVPRPVSATLPQRRRSGIQPSNARRLACPRVLPDTLGHLDPRRPAHSPAVISTCGWAVYDVAAAAILWAFCCVVDTLSERCLRCRPRANSLVGAVFRI